MSGAVNAVVDATKAVVGFVTDPFGLSDQPAPPPVQQVETKTGLSETEKATLAQQEAARKKKQAKSGTSTVLTSPLGTTTTASTAVAKLGGA